jgi:peptidoglycan hydrolase-like protein with peptidoglycan-binding domain
MQANTQIKSSNPVLRKGSKGESVKLLQEILNNSFYYSLKVDGDFGSSTEAAVKDLQKQRGLTVDGIVGPKTWDVLSRRPETLPILRRGSKGFDVKFLQERLGMFGYSIAMDGDFGATTEAAVKRFQQENRLTADGVVGLKTWTVLNQVKFN